MIVPSKDYYSRDVMKTHCSESSRSLDPTSLLDLFPGAMPPIPVVPDASNVGPDTEKPKKRRKRRAS